MRKVKRFQFSGILINKGSDEANEQGLKDILYEFASDFGDDIENLEVKEIDPIEIEEEPDDEDDEDNEDEEIVN